MKESIIKQMSEIVRDIMRSNQTDFTEYDLKSLADYDGVFLWLVHPYHTHLLLLDHKNLAKMVESEAGLYMFCQRNTWEDACLNEMNCGKETRLFLYDGGNELAPVSLYFAKGYWEGLRDWTLFQWQAYHGIEPIPTDFNIPIVFASEETEAEYEKQTKNPYRTGRICGCSAQFKERNKIESPIIYMEQTLFSQIFQGVEFK